MVHIVCTRLDDETNGMLEEMAKKRGMSKSELIRRAIQMYLDLETYRVEAVYVRLYS